MNKKILLLVLSAFLAIGVFAQEQHPENCPFGGVVDCTGQCGLFVDENGDGICDNAVLSKSNKTEKQTDKKASEQNLTQENSVKQTLQADKKQEQSAAKTIQENVAADKDVQTVSGATETMTESAAEETVTIQMPKQERKFPYHLWQVLIATLGLYCLTAVLVKAKKIKKVNHRRLWNVILGITCLVSCLIGVYVVFAKMYGWSMNYLTLMQLHVDFGISMTVIAVIHILWHLNYWKNLFKGAGKKA